MNEFSRRLDAAADRIAEQVFEREARRLLREEGLSGGYLDGLVVDLLADRREVLKLQAQGATECQVLHLVAEQTGVSVDEVKREYAEIVAERRS